MLEDVLFNQDPSATTATQNGGLDLRTNPALAPPNPSMVTIIPPPPQMSNNSKIGGTTQNLPFATSLASLMASDDDINVDHEARTASFMSTLGVAPPTTVAPPTNDSASSHFAHALVDESHHRLLPRGGVDVCTLVYLLIIVHDL